MNSFLFGDRSLTIECAAAAIEQGHTIVGVVTTDPAVSEWARARSIEVLAPGADLVVRMARKPFDLLLSIAYLAIIPKEIVALPNVAAVNFHDGPLPEYAGLNTPVWALLNGEVRHGITWHLMTDQIDAGGILLRRDFDVAADETALSLNLKCYQAAIESFPELLRGLEEGRLAPYAQDPSARKYFGRDRRPDAAGALNWEYPAETIARIARALEFGDYENPLALPHVFTGTESFVARRLQIAASSSNSQPGSIVSADEERLQIATSRGDIEIRELLTPEGAPVSMKAFSRHHDIADGRLPALASDLAQRISSLSSSLSRKEHYWVDRLSTLAPVAVPYSKAHRRTDVPDWQTVDSTVPHSFVSYLANVSSGPDRQVALCAAFGAYLSRLSGQNEFDLAAGHPELKALVAGVESFFSAYVPVRMRAVPDQTFAECLGGVQQSLHEASTNRSFARDVVLRYPQLKALKGAGRCGGLQVTVDLTGPANTDGVIAVHFPADGNRIRLTFDASALAADDAARLLSQFEVFLSSIAAAPEAPLATHDILGEQQRHTLLVEWNQTTATCKDACVHDLFDLQAARTPEAPALAFKDVEYSYRELRRRANRLARYLRAKGLKNGQFVGIYLERSADMVVAVLAVLKGGGAYLPLDPAFPPDRIKFMVEDAAAAYVVTTSDLAGNLAGQGAYIVQLDTESEDIASQSDQDPGVPASPESLAYIIYTSGSTGKPKGVIVEHRNVVNFFTGMDSRIDHDPPGVWLAVTSLSFDISVLELLWTLARGFKVVVYSDAAERRTPKAAARSGAQNRPVDLSLFYFASDESEFSEDKYRLLLEGARFADDNGFAAMWTPERHFYAFGGLYPNPSVAGAAIAAITKRVAIRAGSCVVPLHHPIRVAEEWAVVDNLSRGRVGISFASGWQPHDFVLKPENFNERQRLMFEQIETVRRLWRGEKLAFADGRGQEVAVRTLPRPVQKELPVWITAAGNPETFRQAGERGFNLLTHLLGQSLEELAEKIAIYRKALAGHSGAPGLVTLMLHTFVGPDRDRVREQVRAPMKAYLRSAVGLIQKAAWSFPTFKQSTMTSDGGFSLEHLSEAEMEAVLDFAFERYFESSGLFGTPAQCQETIDNLQDIGVDEVACLIDFGVATTEVLEHFEYLKELRTRTSRRSTAPADYSIPGLVAAHGVTHLQCTPSMISLLLADDRSKKALGALKQLLIGGEAFPPALAAALKGIATGQILNMYGPTETTVWSSVHALGADDETVPIGRPIANTSFFVLDPQQQPVPIGLVGELFIGGAGVARGYHNRPELTSERFIRDPFSNGAGGRLYRTGDLVRYRPTGSLEILGRADYQVKIRGYRIELGEIEARLEQHPAVREAAVIAHAESSGDTRLVGYVRPRETGVPTSADLRRFLKDTLPDYMVPSQFVRLDRFPLTPNKKIDRRALPPPARANSLDVEPPIRPAEAAVPGNELETALRSIWIDLLSVSRVGMEDNFFDLGGHSLLAVRAHRQIREKLQRDVALTDLFRFPTIRSLARHLVTAQGENGASTSTVAEQRIAMRKQSMQRRRRPVSETELTGDN